MANILDLRVTIFVGMKIYFIFSHLHINLMGADSSARLLFLI